MMGIIHVPITTAITGCIELIDLPIDAKNMQLISQGQQKLHLSLQPLAILVPL